VALALLAVLLLPWLGLPLHGWDGRSIWFFHAKWLYYAGGLAADAGWRQPELAFSHPDYPLLLPALAALAAHLAGYWNEHLPQLGLAWLALGPLLAAAAWGRTPVSTAILLLGLPALAGPDLWQGQMDAHLALLVGVGLAWLARAHTTGRRGEAVLGWLLLTLPLSLKNEALLALLLAIVVWGVAHGRRWRGPAPAQPPHRWPRAAWWPVAAALLPWAMWQVYKALWGLRNDLVAGWPGLVARVVERVQDGATLGHLGAALAGGLGYGTVALGIALLVTLAMRRRPALPVLLTALAGLLYAGGLGLVYLATPHDVAWQVQTSAARVLLTAQAALVTALALLVEQWELAWPLRRPPPP
jgi:hypothetical protein